MAPSSNKRKRPERQASEDDGSSRPSPYQPDKPRGSRRASRDQAPTDTTYGGMELENAARESSKGIAGHLEANTPTRAATISSREGTETPAPIPQPALTKMGDGDTETISANGSVAKLRAPYPYEYVTDQIVASWTEAGARSIVETATTLDELQLSDAILELVRSALESRLTGKQAGLTIRNIIASRKDHAVDVEFIVISTIALIYDAQYKGPALKELLGSTGVDQEVMREEFDIPLLQNVDLVRSTFERVRTRKTTNALYRQANFNLLREESEGYAKLITEFFNTANDAGKRPHANPYSAEDAFQRVLALVGAFDLDVGRVLDITMDVSANLLVRAYPFFIKFYRASSWWPHNESLDNVKWQDQGFGPLPSWALPGSGRFQSNDADKQQLARLIEHRDAKFWRRVNEAGMEAFFEIGARTIVDYESILPLLDTEIVPDRDARGNEVNPEKRLRLNEDRKYMRETHALPPSGNCDAAQLLGFKLRFYASAARDADDALPDNVIFIAALLIKIGFISLRDLYPHLHPADEDMPKEKARLEKEKAEKEAKERPGGGINALLAAGALSDDAPPARRIVDKQKSGGATPAHEKKEEVKEELPTPKNQKVMLLKALLLGGALPEALYILGRFPWLAEVDHTLAPFLCRVTRHMLSKVATVSQPMADRGLQDSKEQLFDTTTGSAGELMFTTRPPKSVTRHLWSDVSGKEDDGFEYRHYYTDWSDNIPICQSIEHVFLLCDTFLGYLGANVGQDPELYGTLLRLAHHSLASDGSDSNRSRWLKLVKRLLVPALSCTKHNPQLSQQVFDLLSLWPAATRYNIYAEWFTGATSRRPDVRSALARNKAEVKDVLRRVSNDSVKRQSRALGKIALASPGVVTIEMISQIESYSNMIPSLVECTKYFSPLAYDVLSWTMIKSMSGAGRDRIQGDGMLTSPWLQALSKFVAALYTRYGHLSIAPILQYLASEFRAGDSTDLAMLEEILTEMAGIRSDVELNDIQVLAMAGGEALKTHVLSQLDDKRQEKKSSAQRLLKALKGTGLTGQILVAIAQERQMYAHHESARFMPLKVLEYNLDKVQATFQQYLEVLRHNLNVEDFESAVPDAVQLIKDFGIEPGMALTICRSALQHRMHELDLVMKQETESKIASKQGTTEKNGDIAMRDAVAVKEQIDNGSAETPAPEAARANDEASNDAESGPAAPVSPSKTSPWHPVLEPIIQRLAEIMPKLAARVSIPFYVTFWTLAHHDILMPMDSYQKEVKRLDAAITTIANDKTDVDAIIRRERERSKRSMIETREKLKQEPSEHLKAYIAIRNRISKREREYWFERASSLESQVQRKELEFKHLALLQECFLPRAMLSAIDAHFSFQMIKILHDNGTPGFSMMHLLVQLFKKQQLTTFIFGCTSNEAQHLGRFLCEVLKLLQTWHADKVTFEKEALGSNKKLPGFVKNWGAKGEPEIITDFENFRQMVFVHHNALSQALHACFESGEYMHVRNGIFVLRAVVQVFPMVTFMGTKLVESVKKVHDKEERQDLKLLAAAVLGFLSRREKTWVLPQAFKRNDTVKSGAKSSSRAPSARPETPQPGNSNAKLKDTAAEFTPSVPLANGAKRKESVTGGPEDGEIEDERPSTKKGGDVDMKDAPPTKNDPSSLAKEQPRSSQAETIAAPSNQSTAATVQNRQASSSSLPHRSEPPRPVSAQSVASRQPPTVASRIEKPPLPRPQAGAPSARNSGRYPGRDDGYGRLDRPNDARPPPSREQSPSHRGRGRTPPPMEASRGYRDERPFERPSERDMHDARPRDDLRMNSRRDAPPQPSRPQQDSRDRPQLMSRASGEGVHPSRMSHISSVAVTSESRHPSRPPSRGTPASDALPPDTQVSVNPARLAMINADPLSSATSPRRARDGPDHRRERESRQGERSPQRDDGRRAGAIGGSSREAPQRTEQQADLAPSGPKRERGRLRDVASQGESKYGRLNGPSEAPSGPRQTIGPSSRGGRNFTAPVNARNEPTAQSPTISRPPESPAAFRGPSRQMSGSGPSNMERPPPSGSASTPSTPVSESGPTIHPSRVAAFGQQGPPAPINTNFGPPHGPRGAGSPTVAAPSGPRGPNRGPPTGTPTGPSPASGLPPSGPLPAAERSRRNEQRQRQQGQINATLQGAVNSTSTNSNGQGMSFRGASSRQSSFSAAPPNGPSQRSNMPSVASPMEPPQSRPSLDVRQSFGGPNDLMQGRYDDGPGRRREDDRGARQSSNRDPSREASRRDHQGSMSRPQPPPPPPPQGGPDDGRHGQRDERRSRDDRMRPDGVARDGSQRDRQRPDRQSRGASDMHQGGFGGPPQQGYDNRGPPHRDGAQDDGRRVSRMPSGSGQDMRGGGPPRGPDDGRRDANGNGRARDDASRKHPREEPGGFDPAKRKRSTR